MSKHNPTPEQLTAARGLVANPQPDTPPSAFQSAWEDLKEARGETVRLDRLEPLARAVALASTMKFNPVPRENAVIRELSEARRAAKLSERIKNRCAAKGYPYHGPADGGDAA